MNKYLHIALAVVQGITTFFALFFLYMLFALIDFLGGFDEFVSLAIQTVVAGVISFLTMLVCLLVGLPFRLNKKLNAWWSSHYYIDMSLAALGLLMIFVAWLPPLMENVTAFIGDLPEAKQVPNQALTVTGWFVFAFGMLHFYPPPAVMSLLSAITHILVKLIRWLHQVILKAGAEEGS